MITISTVLNGEIKRRNHDFYLLTFSMMRSGFYARIHGMQEASVYHTCCIMKAYVSLCL